MSKLFKTRSMCVLAMVAFVLVPNAYAGRVELTTYYPAPYGEYKDLKASNSLKVPIKMVNGDTTKVTPGEIWIEG